MSEVVSGHVENDVGLYVGDGDRHGADDEMGQEPDAGDTWAGTPVEGPSTRRSWSYLSMM